MKNVLFLLLAFGISAVAFASDNDDSITTYSVDVQASKVAWKGYKVTGSHHGIITLNQGTVAMKGGALVGGEFIMDMTSLEVRDLTGEYQAKLERHLKSDDFFGTEAHPVSTLKITSVTTKDNGFHVTADLTIKGITEPIDFMAYTKEVEGKMIATADIKVDRSKYNVRYGSNSFFDNLGDKAIYDEFDLNIELVLGQQES